MMGEDELNRVIVDVFVPPASEEFPERPHFPTGIGLTSIRVGGVRGSVGERGKVTYGKRMGRPESP